MNKRNNFLIVRTSRKLFLGIAKDKNDQRIFKNITWSLYKMLMVKNLIRNKQLCLRLFSGQFQQNFIKNPQKNFLFYQQDLELQKLSFFSMF